MTNHNMAVDVGIGMLELCTEREMRECLEDYLKDEILIENCVDLYKNSMLYNLTKLKVRVLRFIDINAEKLIGGDYKFHTLNSDLILEIIHRDSFCVLEFKLLIFVLLLNKCKFSPCDFNNPENLKLLNCVRFGFISLDDLETIENTPFINIYQPQSKSLSFFCKDLTDLRKALPFFQSFPKAYIPRYVSSSIDIITPSKVKVLRGLDPECIFGEINEEYYEESDYNSRSMHHYMNSKTKPTKDGSCDIETPSYLLFEFDKVYIINFIKMLLYDYDNRGYNYIIEASLDLKNWNVICDNRDPYRKYYSLQTIFFEHTPVKYLKITGENITRHDSQEKFEILYLSAMLSNFDDNILRSKFFLTKCKVRLFKKEMIDNENAF